MQRKTTFASVFAIVVFGGAAAGFVGCTSLLGDYEVAPGGTGEGGAGAKANGEACAAGTECTSSFCADGVCCESACNGVCETCGAEKGKCTPVPDGQDPDKECKPEERPDASAPAPDADVPPVDAGDAGDAGASDAAAAEDGSTGAINFPDGGVTKEEASCAGSCNGARACKYPGKETTCGSKFCNTGTQAARYSCSKGHCDLELEQCASFTCENNECRKTCAEQNDCQSTHFCNPSGVCQERLANGLGCSLPDQCKSGFCVVEGGGGVCCNSECNDIPGATCRAAGSAGKCQCSINCGAGSCRLYYRDADGDGFGDKTASVAIAGTTVVGCDNASPPAGYVADKTDCDDGDARAKPGQTGWFDDTTLGKGLNDFNCDGVIQKEIREYPGESCAFCYLGARDTCTEEKTCNALGDQSRLSCAPYKSLFGGITCGYSTFISNTAGFTTTVACGASSSTYRTCGKCTTKAGTPTSSTSTVQQRCH